MTKLLYLENSYLKELEATVVETVKETDTRWQIVLDRTVFYPRGAVNPLTREPFSQIAGKGR